MGKESSVSALLGLTQNDMARILGVTRSQLSMYELGKRSLPLEATLMLAAILKQHKQNEQQKKSVIHDDFAGQQHMIAQLCSEMLIKTNHSIQFLERKLGAARRKQKAHSALGELPKHLKDIGVKKNIEETLQLFANVKSAKVTGTHHSSKILELELKIELLEMKKKFLEQKIKFYG